jgi:hypothetical protein
LPAAAIEREHQLAIQPLAQRMRGRESSELADELGTATNREVGVDARLQRLKAQFVQAHDFRLRECFKRQIGERLTPPQRKALA